MPSTDERLGEDMAEFLLELSGMLIASGDAVSDVESRVRAVASANGYPDLQMTLLPRSVSIAMRPGALARLVNVHPGYGGYRLDQIAEIFNVARDAERAMVSPRTELDRLRRVPTMRNRYSVVANVAGQAIVTVGFALMLSPTFALLWLQAGLGTVVAVLREPARRVPGFDTLLPVVAGTVVAVVGFSLSRGRYDATSISLLVPPLIPLLPGATLTMATLDMTAGAVVAGTSQFVAAFLRLTLLVAGIFVGAQLVGVSPGSAPDRPTPPGSWALWLGLLVFAAGTALLRSVPLTEAPWLLLALVVVFAVQRIGAVALGPVLSGFLGGAVAVPLALLLERFRNAPPAFVTFLPAFWLLVPGSLGLVGIAELGTDRSFVGLLGIVDAIVAVLSIAVGVLVGLNVMRAANAIGRHGPWPHGRPRRQ